MATNFVQVGDDVTVAAPAAVSSGDVVKVGSILGVAKHDAESGADVVLATRGVWTVGKVTGAGWSVGDKLYFVAASSLLSTSASGNTLIGVALAAAASGDATGVVRLNGSF